MGTKSKKETQEVREQELLVQNLTYRPIDVMQQDSSLGAIHLLPKARTTIKEEQFSSHMRSLEQQGIISITKK